ncbi:hypothetical protein [Clostridium butyricum]|uniref:hypothetical protein n=1 Tax=Clostridium butyricum TaxID=1492 RepID=UPI00325BAD06
MSIAGEYTDKVQDYKNIIKSNNIVTDDGELIVNLSERTMDNIAMDFILMEEQRQTSNNGIVQWKKEKTEFQKSTIKNFGHFYFNFYNKIINNIKPQYAVRFLYLSCFMNYNNMLIVNKTTRQYPIYEEDLERLLLLGRSEYFKTKKEFIDKGLIKINEDKTISINDTYCKKGEIMKNKKEEKVRMFENAIKALYEQSKPSEHKSLALLFNILPKINLKWNVICYNPQEEIMEKIVPYDLKDLSKELNQSNITRFKRKLMELEVDGKSVVCINEIRNNKLLTINPCVYYKGTKLEDLEYLMNLFKLEENFNG